MRGCRCVFCNEKTVIIKRKQITRDTRYIADEFVGVVEHISGMNLESPHCKYKYLKRNNLVRGKRKKKLKDSISTSHAP